MFTEIILPLIIFVFILAATYYATKFVSSKANRMMQGKHMRIVETISIGTDKKIILLKAGEKYLLISSSGKNMEFLTEIEIEDAVEEDILKPSVPKVDFRRIFEFVNKAAGKAEKTDKAEKMIGDDRKPLKFKENLDKLKNFNKDNNGTGGPDR